MKTKTFLYLSLILNLVSTSFGQESQPEMDPLTQEQPRFVGQDEAIYHLQKILRAAEEAPLKPALNRQELLSKLQTLAGRLENQAAKNAPEQKPFVGKPAARVATPAVLQPDLLTTPVRVSTATVEESTELASQTPFRRLTKKPTTRVALPTGKTTPPPNAARGKTQGQLSRRVSQLELRVRQLEQILMPALSN